MPVTLALSAFNRRLATGDKLGLHTSLSRGRDDGLLDGLGQRLAIVQGCLNFRADCWLDTDGRKGG